MFLRRFPIAFVNLRVTGVGKSSKPDARERLRRRAKAPATAAIRRRERLLRRRVRRDVGLRRGAPRRRHEFDGPAIIEYADAEIVLPPGMTVRTDALRAT